MSQLFVNSSGGGSGSLTALTGNTGGAVSPTAGNINIVGTGSVSVAGIPGTSTLAISNSGAVALSFPTDSGTGTPSSGVLNIFGGSGITTSATGNTVTITASGSTTLNYTNVATTPYVVLAADQYLGVDSSGGVRTIQLPNAPATGRVYTIKDRTGSAATNNITITTVGGAVNIDGATTFVMNTAYQSVQVLFDGTTYQIF